MKTSKTTRSTSLIRSDYNLLSLGVFATALLIGSFVFLPSMIRPQVNVVVVPAVETTAEFQNADSVEAGQQMYEEVYYEPQPENQFGAEPVPEWEY